MNLRILSDAELLRHADNERDPLITTTLELELAKRLAEVPDFEEEIEALEKRIEDLESEVDRLELKLDEEAISY